jgi:hypothetical protein
MPPKKSSKVIVVFPPSIKSRSDKYNLYLDIRWGEFNKEVKISKETSYVVEMVLKEINQALLEGSETNPFTK